MQKTEPKTIDIFTGTRADYGLLHPLLNALSQDSTFCTRVIIGGEHAWNTTSRKEIQYTNPTGVEIHDLFSLAEGIELKQHSISNRMAMHQIQIEAFWNTHPKPDRFIVLGDRYEAAAVTTCAFTKGIHIVHLAAGDVTQGGALDDQFRFSISCMANTLVAFSAKSYHNLQALQTLMLKSILRTSSLAVDNALQVPQVNKETLLAKYNLDPQKPFALFTQHGIHSEKESNWANIKSSLEALATFQDMQFLITASNTDVKDTIDLNKEIQAFIQPYAHLQYTESTGYSDYINLLRHCKVVVGNSSSGLYETPLFKVPCLNIGSRQLGREHSTNVHHCEYGVEAVLHGLHQVFYDNDFLNQVEKCISPFGESQATPLILSHLGLL